MSPAMRVVLGMAGVAVVASATWANIVHAGSWSTPDALVMIAVATLVALGTAGADATWRGGRRVWAVALGLCLCAGEVFVMASVIEREIATRETRVAPLLEAKARREAAQTRIAAAETATKEAAAAVVSEAAKPGCRRECAALLKDNALRAEEELAAARGALAALPAVRSAAPLAEHIGMPGWAYELGLAILRSLAVFGGSIAIGLTIHATGRLHGRDRDAAEQPSAVTAEPMATRVAMNGDWPSPAILEAPAIPRVALAAPANDAVGGEIGNVTLFMAECVRPSKRSRIEVGDLYAAYEAWCRARGLAAKARPYFAADASAVIEHVGIATADKGDKVYLIGARLTGVTIEAAE